MFKTGCLAAKNTISKKNGHKEAQKKTKIYR